MALSVGSAGNTPGNQPGGGSPQPARKGSLAGAAGGGTVPSPAANTNPQAQQQVTNPSTSTLPPEPDKKQTEKKPANEPAEAELPKDPQAEANRRLEAIIAKKPVLELLTRNNSSWQADFDEIKRAVDSTDKYFPTTVPGFNQAPLGKPGLLKSIVSEVNEFLKRFVADERLDGKPFCWILGPAFSKRVKFIQADTAAIRLRNQKPLDPTDPKFIATPGGYWRLFGNDLHGTLVPLTRRTVTFTNEDVQPSDLQGKFPIKVNIEYRLGTKKADNKYTITSDDIDKRARSPEDFIQDVKKAIKPLMTAILSQFSAAELERSAISPESSELYDAASKLLTLKVNELVMNRFGCTAFNISLDPIRPKWYADHLLKVDAEKARTREVELKGKNDIAEAEARGEAAKREAALVAEAQASRIEGIARALKEAGTDAALIENLLGREIKAEALKNMPNLTMFVEGGTAGGVPPIAMPTPTPPTRKGP
jgi:hypothetical protein